MIKLINVFFTRFDYMNYLKYCETIEISVNLSNSDGS